MEGTTTNDNNRSKRVREDSESDWPEAKRIRDNLLDILDDLDPVVDRSQATEDLDSVMKIFEEEIFLPPPPPPPPSQAAENTPSSDSSESQPDLGFLLEASDDELGLPPAFTSSGEEEKNDESDLLRVSSDALELRQICGIDDEFPSYEPLGFGIGEEKENNGEFLELDGLFDYSDVLCGSSVYSDFSWRFESLQGL